MAAHVYTNPRMLAVIPDWPSGQHRVTAMFEIEVDPKRGERGTRRTTDPRTNRTSKPKLLTYAVKARIVDGDDGKTYIAELDRMHITIMQSNMQYREESIFMDDPRYLQYRVALFDAVTTHNNTPWDVAYCRSLEYIGRTINQWRGRVVDLYAHPTDETFLVSIGVTFDFTMQVLAVEARAAWAVALDSIAHGNVYTAE